ncbi:MAG TPA: hypothetical protein DCR28_04430 [Eubacterium sp.]|nr:hypothetical protein [Eubacterium sp.]
MRTIKKILAVALTLAMVLTIAPTFNTPVKAGDGFNINDIASGVSHTQNPDGTYDVKALKTIAVKLSDLNSKVDNGFKDRYLAGKATVRCDIYKSNGFEGYEATVTPECVGETLKLKVKASYKNKYLCFFIHDSEGGTENLNSEIFKVVPGEIHIDGGPSFGSIYGTKSFLKKNFTIGVNGYGTYRLNDDPDIYTTYKKIVKLYRNGKLVGTLKTEGNQVVFKNIPVSYGKNDTFKAALFMDIEGLEIAGPTTTFKTTSEKVPNIKVLATKISSKKVYLRWQQVGGVSGYYIYMGKKKVKTVGAKTTKKMISKKKAGKNKFKVVPFVKIGKSVYKSSSNKAKPKKNQAKWSRNLVVTSHRYATCDFEVTKISLSGKTYKVTGYALNHRIFKVKKYKSLTIALKVDGKKAFSKKFKRVKLNIGKEKKEKLTFKIKGKAGKDLANGSLSLTVGQDPDWGFKDE